MIKIFRGLISVALLGLCLMRTGEAEASGFMISKFGGDTSSPTSANAASIFWNPAAIGQIDGTSLYLDANLLFRRVSFQRAGTAPDGGAFQEQKLSSFDILPFVGMTADLGTQKFTFGLAAYTPFGSQADWDNEPPGPQRFHSIYGGIVSMFVTPVVAYDVLPTLKIAAGFSYIRNWVYSYRAYDFAPVVEQRLNAGREEDGLEPIEIKRERPENEGRAHLRFGGNSYSFNTGILWEALPGLIWGLSYTHQSDVEIPGTLTIYPPRNQFFGDIFKGHRTVAEEAILRMTLPGAIRTAVQYRFNPKFAARVTFEWVNWSDYASVDLDVKNNNVLGLGSIDQVNARNFHDGYSVRAGGRYQVWEELMPFLGAGFDTSAIDVDFMAPDLNDSLKIGFVVGAEYRPTEKVIWTTGYNHIFYRTVNVTSSAADPPINGEYRSGVDIINTNLDLRF